MFQRKDGLWVERVSVPGRKQPQIFYGKTQKIVKQKMLAWQKEQEKSLTVSEALDRWLEKRSGEVQYKTWEGYQAPAARIRAAFGNEPATELTPPRVQAFVNALAARGYKRTAVQRPLDMLRMLYDALITTEGSGVHTNPTAGVRLPKGLQQASRDLAPREAVEIVKRSLSHPFGLFAYFLMYSGCRDAEALAIRAEDIHDGKIHITKALSWQTNQPVVKEPKTVNGIRRVVLLSPLADALPDFEGYLFSPDGGKNPYTKTEFRARWNGYCRDVGLATCEIERHKSNGKNNRVYERKVWHNTIVPYQLRHEFATLCFDAGLDPADAADLMGHASEQTTRKWYTHIQDQRRETSANKLEAFVTGTKKGPAPPSGTPRHAKP